MPGASTRRCAIVLMLVLLCNGWVSVGAATIPDRFLDQGLRYRLIGPFRGGRVNTVSGIPGDPSTSYFGAAGGGVWKTTDGGVTVVGSMSSSPSEPPDFHYF